VDKGIKRLKLKRSKTMKKTVLRFAQVVVCTVLLTIGVTLTAFQAFATGPQPLQWPANGRITGVCGESRPGHQHAGTDIARTPSTDVHAAYSGVVHWNTVGLDPRGYGNYLDIDHGRDTSGNRIATRYAHLAESSIAPLVREGQWVAQGQLIGHTAVNGDSTGLHLHFELRVNGNWQCPQQARGQIISQGSAIPYRIDFPIPSAPPHSIGDTLIPQNQLNPGDMLTSANGRYVLLMQSDGNLVEYAPGGHAVWWSGTSLPGTVLINQADGNLVLVAPGNHPIWWTSTNRPGTVLTIQDDQNVVAYAPGHFPIWATNTRVP
jgi:murein DD-endopeptidase MepM/ murein hydrolase activator NlpD